VLEWRLCGAVYSVLYGSKRRVTDGVAMCENVRLFISHGTGYFYVTFHIHNKAH